MAGLNDEKFKQMQDEMNRFEEEIGLPIPEPDRHFSHLPDRPKVIGAHTYNEVQKQLAGIGPELHGLGLPNGIPPPPPPPMFVPHQVRPPQGRNPLEISRQPLEGNLPYTSPMFRGNLPPPPPGAPPGSLQASLPPGMAAGLGFGAPPMTPGLMAPLHPGYSAPPGPPGFPPAMLPPSRFMPPQEPQPVPDKPPQPAPAVLSATPMLYVANPQLEIAAHQAENPCMPAQQVDPSLDDLAKKGLKKNKKEENKSTNGGLAMEPMVIQPPVGKKKDKKNRKLVRTAGGTTWEDPTLGEWEEDDFRLFCGDLGNDVTDEVLTRAFSKYASFLKAKVVRDKRTNKTKGFGFVSFKDPQDFIRATKEMNGRYVGSRPIKLRKSTWKNRSLDVVRKKDKEKAALISMLTGR